MILLPNPSRQIGQLPAPPQLIPTIACNRMDHCEATVSNDVNVNISHSPSGTNPFHLCWPIAG